MEALSYLRASSLSLEATRTSLRQRERGDEVAQAHAEEVEEQIRRLKAQQRYLCGKVAYWDIQMNNDMGGGLDPEKHRR